MQGVTELVLVFVFSLLGLLAAVRLRLPPVIGLLLIGALVGPKAFGFINNSETIGSFSEIGAVLLLFVIGIEFSINKIMRFGIRAIIIAFAKITTVFAMVYEVSLLMGMSSIEALILGNIFAVTSTTLFSKLVKDAPEHNKDEINLLFAVLIIEDIFSVFFLTVVSSMGTSVGFNDLAFSIVKSMTILIIAYVLLQKLIRSFFDYILHFKTEEMLVFASLAVCAIFAFLSSAIGLDASIGAFLAGSIIASLKESKKIEKTMLPFGLFFSSFFFLSVGMAVDFGSLQGDFFVILVLLTVTSVAAFVSMSLSTYILGHTSRAAIFSGLTMLAIGEFSLLIAQKSQHLVEFNILGLVSVCVFLTALFSAILVRNEKKLDEEISSRVPLHLKTIGRHVSRYINSVIIEFEPSGRFFRTSMLEIGNIVLYSVLLIVINGLMFMLEAGLGAIGVVFDGWVFWLRIAIHVLVSLGLLFKLLGSIDKVMSAFFEAFRKLDKKDVPLERRIIYDAVWVVVLLFASNALPILFTILGLPTILNGISVLLVVSAIFMTWDAMKSTHELVVRMANRKHGYRNRKTGRAIRSLVMFLNV